MRSKHSETSHSFHSESESNQWKTGREAYTMPFPAHPLPSMQAPFEESMLDSTGETGFVPFQPANLSIEQRQLLCRDIDSTESQWNFTYNFHWRTHSNGTYHPLLKTVAQITFGVYLLHQNLEESVADVADILSKHVNELDSFLRRANEDIEGSLKDMLFRRKCLKVPMEHVSEFDRLLDDRSYRAQLLDGNITIERTINRMSMLLHDYLCDIDQFRNANAELNAYLHHIGDTWTARSEDTWRIYSAMCGNTSGWAHFLQSLAAKAESLGVILVQVSSYCNEIEKRCGAASRRSLMASRASSSRTTNSKDTSRSWKNVPDTKPLPSLPDEIPLALGAPISANSVGTLESRRGSDGQMRSGNGGPIRMVASSDPDDVALEPTERTGSAMESPSPGRSNSGHSQNQAERKMSNRRDSVPAGGDQQDNSPQGDAESSDESDLTALPIFRNTVESTAVEPAGGNVTHLPRRVSKRRKEDASPPLTGKDSAYSSGSVASYRSPTMIQRSASAQSSYPRTQFALFPTSSPSTPKPFINGRSGALSPVQPSSLHNERAYSPLPRSQSALDSRGSPARRLLKKSSFASIKRLFSKKKPAVADTIAE